MLYCITFILWMIKQSHQQTDRFLYRNLLYKNICLRFVTITKTPNVTQWINVTKTSIQRKYFFSKQTAWAKYCLKQIHRFNEIWFVIDVARLWGEKRDLTQPYEESPTPTEKFKKQCDRTKTPPKISITKRLRTDLGRSVLVTIATQLVWLNRLTGSQPSH